MTYWFPVCQDQGAGPYHRRLWGHDLVVWRARDGWRIFDGACPHRKANLGLGQIQNDCLVCPYHGWTFNPDGQVTSVPSASPDWPIPKGWHTSRWPSATSQGLVWVATGPTDTQPPYFPMLEIPELQGFIIEQQVDAPFGWWVENLLDVAHVPFLHPSTYGGTNGMISHDPIEPFEGGFHTRVQLEERQHWLTRLTHGGQKSVPMISKLTVFEPGMVQFDVDNGHGHRQALVALTCPEGPTTCRTWLIARRNWLTRLPFANVIARRVARRVFAEDEAFYQKVLGQGPRLSVPADRASLGWWRMHTQVIETLNGLCSQ